MMRKSYRSKRVSEYPNNYMNGEDTAKKPKILLIEDSKFILNAYRDGLELAGFEVVVAEDGNQADEALGSFTPDLILLDLILPGKDGFEILADLKLDDRLKEIPVIILSNLGQQKHIQDGKELGAVDYLVKADVTLKEVVEKVKFHLADSAKNKGSGAHEEGVTPDNLYT